MTFKLERDQIWWLKEQAKAQGSSQSKVLRETIDKARRVKSTKDVIGDLCGCLNGPGDLSTRKLKGYGRD